MQSYTEHYLEEMEQSRDSEKRTPVKVADKVTQTLSGEQIEIHGVAESKNPINLKSLMTGLDRAELVELANLAFLELALQNGINSNPANFAELAMHAMKRLQDNGKNNLIYKFALCIASNRPGSSDSLFPINRMPFGMVEYQIEFFSATNIRFAISLPCSNYHRVISIDTFFCCFYLSYFSNYFLFSTHTLSYRFPMRDYNQRHFVVVFF